MNMITGIDRPTTGSVVVDDRRIDRMNEEELAAWRGANVGIIFQFFQLLPSLSALENAVLPLDFAHRGSKRERYERARHNLELVGLADKADHLPSELSGGQQQRVAIARALVTRPEVVFADEPTGNLDSRSGREVLGLLASASREHGQSIAMVTHDPVAASHADRVLFLGDGRIVADKPRRSAEEISAYMLATELGAGEPAVAS